ncbi:hypothetical protein [Poseidonia sp.]|uniref:hypothetical protein n=1 Tax=Poseidonia sp. TaxID=2666344 RepID=UPI003F6981FC
MSTFTAESHRGAGALPVPTTPLTSHVEDINVVLVDGPVIDIDGRVSNADVGEEQNLIGPIESPFIRGRANNT